MAYNRNEKSKDNSNKKDRIKAIVNNKEKYRNSSEYKKPKVFVFAEKHFAKFAITVALAGGIWGAVKYERPYEAKATYAPSDQYQKYRKYDAPATTGLALLEGFYNEAYNDKAGNMTQGYGNTKVNGNKVTIHTLPIDRTLPEDLLKSVDSLGLTGSERIKEGMYRKGREHVVRYLDETVYPTLEEHVKVPLNDHEMLGTILFFYNIGKDAFVGSEFLKALNNGEKGVELAKKMTGFRSIKGSLATGLLKREWAIINTFLNTPVTEKTDDGKTVTKGFVEYIPNLKPEHFYDEDASFYYKEKMGSVGANGYYTPKLDSETMTKFLKENIHDKKNVNSIIDLKTRAEYTNFIKNIKNSKNGVYLVSAINNRSNSK